MPVAKRVAVAVMADTVSIQKMTSNVVQCLFNAIQWQMAEARGTNVEEEIKKMTDLPMGFMEKVRL